MVTGQAPRAGKVSEIVSKVVQENLDNTCKKSYWLHLPFFHEFFYGYGVVTTPPDAINCLRDFFICRLCRCVSKTFTLSDCTTHGARKCIFPFSHHHDGKIVNHTKCAPDDQGNHWCATDLGKIGKHKHREFLDIGMCDMETCKGDPPGDGTFSLFLPTWISHLIYFF